MSEPVLTPDHLFDGPWRPGHLLRARHSRLRRWGMVVLFLFLCGLIAGYLYITDAQRVRAMAESYLSSLTGGRVHVTNANLSLFEGLRLNDVRVYVDDTDQADSILFSADTFLLKYDPRELIQGRLRAEQIIATEPHVHLTENVDTGKWNYQRLNRRNQGPTSMPTSGRNLPALPEILLRRAQVDYSEIRDGEYRDLGSLAIEAQLTPAGDDRYVFEIQTRGASERAGAGITGTILPNVPQFNARVEGFEFGRDVLAMLPGETRAFLQQHELAGRVNVPVSSYTPARDGQPATFRVEIEVDGVTMVVHPEEWMGRDELRRRAALLMANRMLASLYEPSRPPVDSVPEGAIAPFYDQVVQLLRLEPIRLQRVSGRFVFTEKGVTIHDLAGRLENNALVINSRIDGYSPLAPAWLRLESAASEHVYIPPAPAYIRSLPKPVRDVYEHLRPQGTCDIKVELLRQTPGARPIVSGEVNVIDGQFVSDRFTYPIRNVTGRLTFGRDEQTGQDALHIVNLRGYGVQGGANAGTPVVVNGKVAPLGGQTGVDVVVTAENIVSEPTLHDAFPAEVRDALRIFDADQTGQFPQFRGDFRTHIYRAPGRDKRWLITTDIRLDDASGKLTMFPYPLEHVSGRLTIHNDYLDIPGITMRKGDATLDVKGRVRWKDELTEPWRPGVRQPVVIRPDLDIHAAGVPLDADLLGALPADAREWIQSLGVNGRLDVEGRVFRKPDLPSDAPLATAISHEFDLVLCNGSAWPADGTFSLTDLSARMRLLPDRMLLSDVNARRGDAAFSGRGTVSWPNKRPQIAYQFTGRNMLLEPALYAVLPHGAQQAWDQVQPQGTVDVDVVYSGNPVALPEPSVPSLADDAATTRPSSQLAVSITPRDLSATVRALPYRLDQVKGMVQIVNDQIHLQNLSATHGPAVIRLSGHGSSAADGAWNLKLAGDDVPVDEAFIGALPTSLRSVTEAMKLNGTLSFDFAKLVVRGTLTPPAPSTAPIADADDLLPAAETDPLDLEFDVVLKLPTGSADVGVPVTDLSGQAQLTGTVRDGSLSTLDGTASFQTLSIASRPARDFGATIHKSADEEMVRITSLSGQLAGGELAGDIDLAIPEDDAARYGMRLVLRNADVKQIAAETEPNLSGQLTASLALEGAWSDPTSRRGRGDVSVRGQEMYKIPLVLGLLQVTNLALPISSPFNDAAISYNVDGQRVTFEQITLRSRDMLMQGDGSLDFGTKAVRMSFTTDNPNWPQLPIIGPIMQGARHEMLRIHVRGTLQDPQVTAAPAATFTTTIDEVLRGDGP